MHGEELVVGFLRQHAEQGQRQLGSHDQRQNAGEKEKQESRANVPEADVIIVDDSQPLPALRRSPDPLKLLNLAFGPFLAGGEAFEQVRIEPDFRHFCASR